MKEFLLRAICTACIVMSADCFILQGQDVPIKLENFKDVARVTGQALQGETLFNPNSTWKDYDVYGTDLGIMWKMSGKRFGLFFGDTSGKGFEINKNGGNGTNWRSNVLGFSSDSDLSDGLTIDSMALDKEGKAREICAGGKTNPQKYQTSIPTSAIRAGKVDCVHYMNIYDWGGGHGRWLTNFSSLYYSENDGRDWTRCETVTFSPNSHFSQVAYAEKGRWIYMIGTQSGRGDFAYLARFRKKDILDKEKYEYWNGNSRSWVKGAEESATPIIRRPVGEASLVWNKKFRCWILTFNYDGRYDSNPVVKGNAILYTASKDITNWGEPELVTEKYYGGFISPMHDKEDVLWLICSDWGRYNTFLVRADIVKR